MGKLQDLWIKYAGYDEYSSKYGYLSGYKYAKPIEEQISILRDYWPKLEPGKNIVQLERKPFGPHEGTFAIVHWEAIAPNYNEGLKKEVLEAIKTQRKGNFYNKRECRLGPQYLRQTERAVRSLKKLGEEQKGHDILIVPAQFGLHHRGRSVRRARAIMNSSEFGLGAFAVGIMLLTHPERLKHYDDLWIDCAGDEQFLFANGRFDYAPSFYFFDGKVYFDACWFGHALVHYGSVSGFVSPQ